MVVPRVAAVTPAATGPAFATVRTVRAAVQTGYGGPDVVRLADVERPVAGPRDLLVRVHATTVNRTDTAYRVGTPAFLRVLRARGRILGTEYAGVVEEAGAEVTGYAAGDRVFGYSEGPFGAHAEYLAVRADGFLAPIPDGLTFAQAVPATEGAHYAQSCIRRAGIRPGQTVLVYGATGAIGSAAVQLLAAMDVAVTAVCATAHLELVRSLGAGHVIDYTAEDFTRSGGRYDAVIDAVGKSTFGACRRLLGPRGVYVSGDPGPFLQNVGLALVTPLLRRRRVVFPVPLQRREMIEELRALLADGRFRPVVDRHYPLAEIAEAHRYVDTGTKVGNVVIDVVTP
ncbi:NAD(P)-dependent alcohol dehydrogenase [Jiangella ureilytica]|uniref:NAD(P)-dependent alcohol dehydrogenase n=1 Tax=Jiangella ureilytica TaxID=2530374 RepID=A0A4R4S540_9ACTN|nr:NAD(P)-dependent alcohol dehydrogenase [Jiangella ureilytica]